MSDGKKVDSFQATLDALSSLNQEKQIFLAKIKDLDKQIDQLKKKL